MTAWQSESYFTGGSDSQTDEESLKNILTGPTNNINNSSIYSRHSDQMISDLYHTFFLQMITLINIINNEFTMNSVNLLLQTYRISEVYNVRFIM